MNVLLLYNPRAGSGNFNGYLDDIIRVFQEKKQYIIPYRLQDLSALEDFMKALEPSTIDKVIIAGGDGTIHQVVNLMLRLGIDLPVAIFPLGTANDFAQYFHIPREIDGMIQVATGDKTLACDIGKANDRYFINVASFGNLVDISQRVNEQAKNILGVLAYYMKGIEEIPKLKPFRARIVTDDAEVETDILFTLVMNGRSAGGFKKLAPYAEISDGLFDVLIFKKCPVLEIMPLLVKVWNGEHPKSDYIRYLKTSKLEVTCRENIVSDLDGETGPALPLKMELLNKRLRVVVPQDY